MANDADPGLISEAIVVWTGWGRAPSPAGDESLLEEAMATLAVDQFRGRHPDLTDDAIQALAWCYTYDYR